MVILIIIGAIIIGVCILTGKFRNLAASYGLLTAIPQARGDDFWEDTAGPVVEYVFMAAVSLALLVWVIKQLARLYLRRHAIYKAPLFFSWNREGGRQTYVLLELGNPAEFIILQVQTLVGSPLRFRLNTPTVSPNGMPKLRYKTGCMGHRLNVDWKEVYLVDDVHQQQVLLNTVLSIPLSLRQAAKRVLSQPLSMRLLVGSQGVYDSMPIISYGNEVDPSAPDASYHYQDYPPPPPSLEPGVSLA